MGKLIEDPLLRNKLYVFQDRFTAGERLAEFLKGLVDAKSVVLAIPAGGVPVGLVVAKKLSLPFRVLVVRKVHIPWNPEAGFGAMAWDGTVTLNQELVEQLRLTQHEVEECIAREKADLEARVRRFMRGKTLSDVRGKSAILVDDGLASGYTMLVAVKSVEKLHPARIVVAVPTASAGAINLLLPHVSCIACLNVRNLYPFAVADAYRLWYDLSEDDVEDLLKQYGI